MHNSNQLKLKSHWTKLNEDQLKEIKSKMNFKLENCEHQKRVVRHSKLPKMRAFQLTQKYYAQAGICAEVSPSFVSLTSF